MADNTVSGKGADASRRAVVGGLVGLGVGVPLLTACRSDNAAADSGSGSGGTTSSGSIAKKADVPVGGGKIFKDEKVVITQPTAGDFKAFSAVCTHQGCVVAKIVGQDIDCGCHGSKFSLADGSVVNGPATKPLPALKVTASGEDLSVS
ncbi:MAG: Rieske (2Fe-2S) protein [Marmoricola sp.]|jgi:Rieske Fe-S protein|nr:Rieske (2Fe-2S) protein [Marmoricola sp.]